MDTAKKNPLLSPWIPKTRRILETVVAEVLVMLVAVRLPFPSSTPGCGLCVIIFIYNIFSEPSRLRCGLLVVKKHSGRVENFISLPCHKIRGISKPTLLYMYCSLALCCQAANHLHCCNGSLFLHILHKYGEGGSLGGYNNILAIIHNVCITSSV